MSRLPETILYSLAKRLYSSELAQTPEMKEAVRSRARYDAHRARQADRIIEAARLYGVPIADKRLIDLGCNDGAISVRFPKEGAVSVIGVDIQPEVIELARERNPHPQVEYRQGSAVRIPVQDVSIDAIICFDVFEHVSRPLETLRECHRILAPGGTMLIGTWGWGHPFAPHLFHTMPVPWAHLLFSEKTLLSACRRVYHSSWYQPNMHDFGPDGERIPDRYLEDSISTDYLNKYKVRDFERVFEESGFSQRTYLRPFSSLWARWTGMFLGVPGLREYLHSYLWAVLTKPS